VSDDLPMDDNLRGLLVELAERPEEIALGARVHRFQDLLRPDAIVLRTRIVYWTKVSAPSRRVCVS